MKKFLLRVAKVSAMARIRGLATHNTREVRPPNADPEREKENLVFLGDRADLVLRDVRELVPKTDAKGRETRKDAVRALEFVIQADKGLTRLQQIAFMKDSLEFVKKNDLGVVVQAVGHFDEVSPHMHILTVPLTKDKRLSASKVLGNTVGYQQLQSKFQEQVGKKYGLEREMGSKARHFDQKAFYRAVNELVRARELIATANESGLSYDMLPLEQRLAKAEEKVTELLKVEKKAPSKDSDDLDGLLKKARMDAIAKLATGLSKRNKREAIEAVKQVVSEEFGWSISFSEPEKSRGMGMGM